MPIASDPATIRDAPSADAARALVDALEHLYRDRLGRSGTVPLHEPWFRGNEWVYVKDCIDTNWVSSVGSYVDRFEEELARYCGTAFAIATANGTVALHAALHALGGGRGDIDICPAVSFVATANSIAHCGATPLFLDVDARNLGLGVSDLERFLAAECRGEGRELRHASSGRRIAAVMAVHLFGHPAAVHRLRSLCAARQVPLVEDAAQAVGSFYHGRHCGSFGAAGILSFNGNKIITTGGGGAILTDNVELARRLKHLTTTARLPHDWEYDHDEVGFNYRMTNLSAALGCAQLEQLDEFLARKRRVAVIIADALCCMDEARLLREPDGAKSNFWLNALLLHDANIRDAVLTQSNQRGIQTRSCWRLLPDLPMFCKAPIARSGVAVARDLAARLINIPSSANLVGDE